MSRPIRRGSPGVDVERPRSASVPTRSATSAGSGHPATGGPGPCLSSTPLPPSPGMGAAPTPESSPGVTSVGPSLAAPSGPSTPTGSVPTASSRAFQPFGPSRAHRPWGTRPPAHPRLGHPHRSRPPHRTRNPGAVHCCWLRSPRQPACAPQTFLVKAQNPFQERPWTPTPPARPPSLGPTPPLKSLRTFPSSGGASVLSPLRPLYDPWPEVLDPPSPLPCSPPVGLGNQELRDCRWEGVRRGLLLNLPRRPGCGAKGSDARREESSHRPRPMKEVILCSAGPASFPDHAPVDDWSDLDRTTEADATVTTVAPENVWLFEVSGEWVDSGPYRTELP